MKLTQLISHQVSSGARSRGASYFASGAVQDLVVIDGALDAVVLGSESYFVRVEPKRDRLVVSCSCPYFGDRLETCKHVWAVLLAAEAQSLAVVAPGTRRGAIDVEPVELGGELENEEDLNFGEGPDDRWSSGGATGRGEQPPRSRVEPAMARQLARPEATRPQAPAPRPQPPAPPPPLTPWRLLFKALTFEPPAAAPGYGWQPPPGPVAGQLLYVIDTVASRQVGALVVELMTRDRKANGEWGKPKATTVSERHVRAMAPGDDRRALEKLLGARPFEQWAGATDYGYPLSRCRLTGGLVTEFLPLLCATGGCVARGEREPITGAPQQPVARFSPPPPKLAAPLFPVTWDDGPPWRFEVRIRRHQSGGHVIDGWLARDGERMEIGEPLLVLADGALVTRTTVARLDPRDAFTWLAALRENPAILVPEAARTELLDALIAQAPPLQEAPDELRVEIVAGEPRPRLRLGRDQFRRDRLLAEASFDYDGTIVPAGAKRSVVRASAKAGANGGANAGARAIRRDLAAEARLLAQLEQRGCRRERFSEHSGPVMHVPMRSFPKLVADLLADGWHVEAEGRTYRRPGRPSLAVHSGIDWFELHGEVSFDGHVVGLPALLAALARGESFVVLDDGTIGMLPEGWLRTQATLARFGKPAGDHLRFEPSQAALLDALLEAQPDVSWDETFARARERLQDFDGIRPLDAPATFAGELRPYQCEGLGWFHFLEQFGFGGCLADDMGLGKTVMVLALLDRRRAAQPAADRRPSLVVVPRSLVFNWREEARRFTPGLRVLDYSGTARAESLGRLEEADLVVTTYGTLRRDAARLAAVAFDYVVLDEAQAIKNAQTASAKACRLLVARHRLALSGTPVENHLGELGSLFEFLNPGLLGRAAFASLARPGAIDQAQLELLARGLRPFILRRTKEQVAKELPKKSEQTIFCELERPQRALYDELLRHYRGTLLARVGEQGMARSKLQILEALLRLRQAACHPGLIDKARTDDSSAKLDVLVPRLLEAVDEGHKTLVFSQFTSFLAILRARLDQQGIVYEYLDGRTRDRESRVARFQTDESCRLFLISLKAGGLGLNLTAAEYVFLLDPWWNPAVEAQAVDRAHRIGQARRVFAYRLIARDTVEERVLELQQRKRKLAEAILQADGSVLRDLRRDDLELLLS